VGVSAQLLTLVLVVVVALGFDFTNGFHDTGNSMATSIATGALKPKTAVALSAILNLVGAFLSVEVAITVTNAVVDIQDSNGNPMPSLTADHGSALLMIILAGLIGGILWNVGTWLLGLPSSSSHALFGGLIGATVAGIGWSGVHWTGDSTKLDGVLGKVVLPAVASPIIAAVVSMLSTWVIFKVTARIGEGLNGHGFRVGQIGSASLMSLAHGTNDAQKTMGVITLALIGYGSWHDPNAIPLWVKVSCAAAIALGTYLGGWRIIRTLGKGLVEIEPRQGMAAQGSAAAVILASSQLGFALSTTHVATGAILGSGVGKPGGSVRWSVAGRMVVAWLITLPMAGAVGAATWYVGDLCGGGALGALVMVAILVVLAGWMFNRSRREPINSDNVNEVWNATSAVVEPSEPVAA
jgi:inorganic phosphate transporter, PiT family